MMEQNWKDDENDGKSTPETTRSVCFYQIALSKGPRKHMATDLETLELRPYRLELLSTQK